MKIIDVTNSSSNSYINDEGLRSYMVYVFKYMSVALAITGLVSFLVASSTSLVRVIFGSPLAYVVMFAPLIFNIYFYTKIWKIPAQQAKNYLFIFAILMGVSISFIFLVYTATSITRTFFIASATFLAMCLYGSTTKKDLTGIAQFMYMGLIGVIIASIVNIFTKSTGMEYTISILCVVIFTVLTAFDVQRLKQGYDLVRYDTDNSEKLAVIGALNLYMDFINLFLHLLRLLEGFGGRRN